MISLTSCEWNDAYDPCICGDECLYEYCPYCRENYKHVKDSTICDSLCLHGKY